MKLLRVLPLYAMSALLALGLALVANARDWTGRQTLLAAAIVAFVYLATVVVPWLLRDLAEPRRLELGAAITDLAKSQAPKDTRPRDYDYIELDLEIPSAATRPRDLKPHELDVKVVMFSATPRPRDPQGIELEMTHLEISPRNGHRSAEPAPRVTVG
jgi:hypothetical protein